MRVYFFVGIGAGGRGAADYDVESDEVTFLGVYDGARTAIAQGYNTYTVRTPIAGKNIALHLYSGESGITDGFAQEVLRANGIETLPEYVGMVKTLQRAGELIREQLPHQIRAVPTLLQVEARQNNITRTEVRALVERLSHEVRDLNNTVINHQTEAAKKALVLQEAREYLRAMANSDTQDSRPERESAEIDEAIQLREEVYAALPSNRDVSIEQVSSDARGNSYAISWITPESTMSDGLCVVEVPSQQVYLTVRDSHSDLREYFHGRVFNTNEGPHNTRVKVAAHIEVDGVHLPATPHVGREHPFYACLDTTGTHLQTAWDEGRYYDLVALVEAWLRTYDPEGGPHYSLPRWAGMLDLPISGDYPDWDYAEGHENVWGINEGSEDEEDEEDSDSENYIPEPQHTDDRTNAQYSVQFVAPLYVDESTADTAVEYGEAIRHISAEGTDLNRP
jgi:hypothetical protein